MLKYSAIIRISVAASLAVLQADVSLGQNQDLAVVANGVATQFAVPGGWLQQDDFVQVTSPNELLADHDLGTGDFRIHGRLRMPDANASGAALQLGDTFFGIAGPNQSPFISGRLVGGHHIQLSSEPIPVDSWTSVDIVREGPTITLSIDGQIVHSIFSLAPIGQVGLTFAPLGRVPPEPTDLRLLVQELSVEGQMNVAGSIEPGGYSLPIVDLAHDAHRQVLVDREPGQYLGHPTTVLLDDGQTIIAVYPKGHGRGPIVMKKSLDGGLTWSSRLPVPDNWATSLEVPTLFPVTDPQGQKRLIMFSGLFPIRMAVSEDMGDSWTSLEPIGDYGGIVAMSEVIRLQNGDYMAYFHDDGRFINGQEEQRGQFFVYQIRSTDGGMTWSRPEVVVTHPQADLCEPGVIRSPDGTQLAMLLRENSRQFNSFLTISNDDGTTWSPPVELPGALTGDRHQAVYAPDGRLFISFRDRTHVSSTWGDWVGWVGTYEDIVQGREGQYRVRIMDNLRDADTAYPGVELLPDGTIVTTTYGHWTADESPYVMSVRFKLEELDRLAATP